MSRANADTKSQCMQVQAFARVGPISTLLQHTPNEYASIRTSAGYLSKEIGSGVARGGGWWGCACGFISTH